MKVDRKFIQIFMHHKSPDSQDVYTQPTRTEATQQLERAMDLLSRRDDTAILSDITPVDLELFR
jgi:hypothetical protein